MIDGKVCNTITGQKSTQSCYICSAKPSDMNNFQKLESLTPNKDTYKLGLSTLHAWIRCFEYLLHISYKLVIFPRASSKARLTAAETEKVQKNKKEIQDNFKLKLGLNVDMPKQGFGNTNDGNTARAFFKNPAITSEITGVDTGLIKRFHVILTTLSSGYEIDVDKYALYCRDTAKMCINLYGWYTMPPSVHKILFHGAAIIEAAPLPIGMMSEDAQEANHKKLKYVRLAHTRKHDRTDCNRDLLNACLVSSDPVTSSKRSLPKKATSSQTLDKEVLLLLKSPDLHFAPMRDEDSDEGTDSD